MDAARPARLLKLLLADPRELYDRVTTRLEVREEHHNRHPPSYRPISLAAALGPLEEATGWRLGPFLEEPALRDLETAITNAKDDESGAAGFPSAWDAGLTLARLCYALCRAARPATVLETGVARGISTAFLLQALDVNGRGVVHSVEPAARELETRPFVGRLVPDELRHRWRLHAGRSRRVLPSLLPTLPEIDLFVQDSLHTYRTTTWELGAVEPYLSDRSVILADDIEANSAWGDWSDRARLAFSQAIAIEGKGNLCGLGVSAPRS